jgi:hypothetical protein
MREMALRVLAHGVGRHCNGLIEHHLAYVDSHVVSFVDRLSDACGGRGELAFAFRAVSVKLKVGQVDGAALGGLDGRQGGLVVARQTQVAGVHVQWMRYAQLSHRAGQYADDVPRPHAVMRYRLVHVEPPPVELESVDATRVHHLDADTLRRAQSPGNVIVDDRLLGAFGQQFQQKIVVA